MANKQSPTNRKFRRNLPRARSAGGLNESLARFKHHQDVNVRIDYAEQLAKSNQSGHLAMAGSMLVETATDKSLDITEKQALLDQGRKHWDEVVIRSKRSEHSLNGWASGAVGRLATFDSLQWLIAGDRIGPLATTSSDYEKLVEAGQAQAHSLETNKREENRMSAAGDVAETSVTLLLMRFALDNEDGEYLPTFSHISEDQGNERGTWTCNRWDVSVFTQYDLACPPERKHQIQVKSGKANADLDNYQESNYDESFIDLVHVRDDLSFSREKMPAHRIIQECAAELGGDTGIPSYNLDERTKKLLTIMD